MITSTAFLGREIDAEPGKGFRLIKPDAAEVEQHPVTLLGSLLELFRDRVSDRTPSRALDSCQLSH